MTFPLPLELRRRAVRMVAEVGDDYPTETAALQAVAEKLGIGSRETLRNWLKQHEIDAGQRPGTTEESAQLKALKKENAELTDTIANRADESPLRPSAGNQSAKSSSVNSSSSRSRTHIAAVPRGLLARAIRTVNGGITRPVPDPIAIAASPSTARSAPLPSEDHHE
ncbi:hypothetical protein [Streptomyces sp. HUAS TT7]|uniref:hypothetical protein n=1 Tax=Streptomyces sp. HUAS TT7 TaxID=3447507 RepID=UPI003F65CB66